MLKIKRVWLSAISGPLVFIVSGEFASEAIRARGFFILIVAAVATAISCYLIYLWQKKYVSMLLFGIGSPRFEGTKRTSMSLGAVFGAPLSIFAWLEYDAGSYVSSIPYVLMAPGIAALGFIAIASLVCVVVWCAEGFLGKGKDLR